MFLTHQNMTGFTRASRPPSTDACHHTSGVSTAPAATADSMVRSQWTTRDAVACLAVRSHLPPAERAHFGQYKTTQSLYDAVVARYSSPATAALNRLMLPYLLPDLAAFATVADLITHLRTSDARYRAALPTDIVAVGASRSDRRAPFFEGCSPVPLLPSVASAAAVDLVGTEEVGAASAPNGKRRNSKGKGGKGGGGDGVGGGGGGGGGGGDGSGGGGGGGSGGFGGGGGVGGGSGSGGGGSGSGGGGGGGGGAGRGGAAQRGGFGGSQRQQQPRSHETLSVQQLREWYAGRGRSGGVGPCTYVLRTGGPRGETQNVAIFDLDFDAILAAMYAMSDSAEGDCYLCVPPDPGIEAAALGASESAAPGTGESDAPGAIESALFGIAPTEALHTFTLDSGASRSFFRDSTTLTPLSRPVAVSLADPSGGPVLAHSSTVLPCPVAPSGLLLGLHLPSFSTNLVSRSDLQDAWVDQFTPGGQRVTHSTCSRTGRHLATFTRRPGSSLYTLTIASSPVTAFGQVAASGQVLSTASRSSPASAPCSCRPLSHETLLWHHRLGHPSLPQAPLQTLHMDVWGPARVRGQGHERYFLLVVDDYSRYTTVFALCHKDRGGEFSPDLLRAFCRAEGIRQTFTLPASPQQNGIAEHHIGMVMDVARTSMIHAAAPHFLWPFVVQYAAHQISLQPRVSLPETTPTLRWTGKVGDASVFRVWGSRAFVRDPSADKLSSRAVPCVFLGFPPDAPGWQFYLPTSRRVLSSQGVTFDESVSYYRLFPYRTAPLPPPTTPPSTRYSSVRPPPPSGSCPLRVRSLGVLSLSVWSLGVAEPGGAESGGAERGGAEPERAESGGPPGVPSRREPLSPQQLREWYARRCRRAAGATGSAAGGASGAGGASRAGAARGAAGARAAGAAGPGGAGARGTDTVGGPAGVGAAGGAGAAGPRGARTGGTGAAGAGGASGVGAVGAGAVATRGATGVGAVGGTGAGGAAGVVAGDPGAEGTGAFSAFSRGAARPRPYYVPLLQQVLGLLPSTGPTPPLLSPLPVRSPSQLQPASPLPGPSPYFEPTRGLTESREPESRPASPESRPESPVRPVCTGRRVPRQRPPPIPGTHSMTLRTSSAPQHVPLPSPPASSLPAPAFPESNSLRAASPTVTRLLATVVTDPSFESIAASAFVTELVDFAAHCHLDYTASVVAESVSEEFECFAAVVPHLVSMLLAPEGDPDAPDIPTLRSYAEAIEGPYSSQWLTAMDTEMASWKSTGTYVDEVPPPGPNIVSGMWIFRVKRLPGSPPVFKARYVARGFSQGQGVDFFQTFSPTPKMTTLWVLLHVAAQRDYKLHSLDFSTAFLQGSLHEEIWLRCPPGFTGSFPADTQWSLRRLVYGLRQAPREWQDTLRTTLAALGFAPSTTNPSLFLCTDATLPPFYVLVYVDDLVFATADTKTLAHVKSELQKRHTCTDLEPSGPYPELVGCLMYLMSCTRPDLAYPLSLLARYVAPSRHRKVHWDDVKRVLRYLCSTLGMGLVLGGRARVVLTGHADASWVDDLATQRSSQGYTFSLGSSSVSWRSTHSSSVLSSSCKAEIYAGAMAAQELRWLTYLLTDLGEPPRSPPVLYQRGQLRLAYVASRANTADVFTTALQPCDHQPTEDGGTGAAGPGGAGSRGARGVRVETTPVEDTAVSIRRPRPVSPPGISPVPQFPPHSSLRPVAAEPGGVLA
ncbi:unnamed protein product [Closterium sp. NIES-53]